MRLGQLIQNGMIEDVASMVTERVGVEVEESDVSWVMESEHRDPSWTDSTYLTWIKSNLTFDHGGESRCSERFGSCQLNVGFIFIEETEDHKQRLLNEKTIERPSRITSGLSWVTQFITAINKTTSIVSGIPKIHRDEIERHLGSSLEMQQFNE